MTKFEMGMAAFAVIVTLMLGYVTIQQAQSGATADRIDAAATRLDTQVSRIDEAFSQIAGTNLQVTQVATTINGIDKTVAVMNGRLDGLASRMDSRLDSIAKQMDERAGAIEATLAEINRKLASSALPKSPIVFDATDYGAVWGSFQRAEVKGPIFMWSTDPETLDELERIRKMQQ